jgi:hypothetical protein
MVKHEGRNGTIQELALLVVMQGIEDLWYWRSRRKRIMGISTGTRMNSLTDGNAKCYK